MSPPVCLVSLSLSLSLPPLTHSLSLGTCIYVEESSPWRRPPLLGSFLASRIFSAHFLTARRTARYGDQMRADRVSSIVYTLKKPLLLTSRRNITIYFPPPSTPALFLFRLSVSLFASRVSLELSSERNCPP